MGGENNKITQANIRRLHLGQRTQRDKKKIESKIPNNVPQQNIKALQPQDSSQASRNEIGSQTEKFNDYQNLNEQTLKPIYYNVPQKSPIDNKQRLGLKFTQKSEKMVVKPKAEAQDTTILPNYTVPSSINKLDEIEEVDEDEIEEVDEKKELEDDQDLGLNTLFYQEELENNVPKEKKAELTPQEKIEQKIYGEGGKESFDNLDPEAKIKRIEDFIKKIDNDPEFKSNLEKELGISQEEIDNFAKSGKNPKNQDLGLKKIFNEEELEKGNNIKNDVDNLFAIDEQDPKIESSKNNNRGADNNLFQDENVQTSDDSLKQKNQTEKGDINQNKNNSQKQPGNTKEKSKDSTLSGTDKCVIGATVLMCATLGPIGGAIAAALLAILAAKTLHEKYGSVKDNDSSKPETNMPPSKQPKQEQERTQEAGEVVDNVNQDQNQGKEIQENSTSNENNKAQQYNDILKANPDIKTQISSGEIGSNDKGNININYIPQKQESTNLTQIQ